ncbi:MAG: DNA polymerase II, partial [Desulfurococcales archaeon]|nr:DNA polymerase II [Desulfurococcales archaeon]
MEKVFQLLDVTYEIVSGAPSILIYARDAEGSRIILVHDRFRPYFYVILEDAADPGRVAGEIKRLSEPGSPVLEVQEDNMRYIGRPVKALRVTTLIPASVRRYREKVARIPGVREVLEADIRFAMRFMIDHNLYPMRWYRAEVEKHRGLPGYRVDGFYRVTGQI